MLLHFVHLKNITAQRSDQWIEQRLKCKKYAALEMAAYSIMMKKECFTGIVDRKDRINYTNLRKQFIHGRIWLVIKLYRIAYNS